jgi:AcrR family transcriptional regulator
MLAACLRDADAAARMRSDYRTWDEIYTGVGELLLERSEREPVEGLRAVDLARMIVAAMDGAAQRVRCDPDLGEEFVTQLFLGLWAGLTRPVGDEDDLLERRVAGPVAVELSAEEVAAVAAAVRRVNDTAGWPAVSLRKVAQLSGLSVGRLARAFPDRDHLSTILWEDLLAGIERRAGADRSGPWERLEAFLHDLADVACTNRRLTASMLAVRMAAGPDPDAGGSVVGRLIEIVRRIMEADPAADEPYDAPATLLVESVLVRAACSDIRADTLARTILSHVH